MAARGRPVPGHGVCPVSGPKVLRWPRADQVHTGEYVLIDGRRRQVTDTGRSQRWVRLWLDGNLTPLPDLQLLEHELVTVVA